MYLTTTVQNQNLMMFPHNDITQHLYYNQRFIVDSRANTQGLGSYLTWETSKVESMFPPGVIQLTLNQGLFRAETDRFDPDNGYLYADYPAAGDLKINHSDEDSGDYSKIELIGTHSVRVAGTGKKLKLRFYDKNDQEISKSFTSTDVSIAWSINILNKDGTAYTIADLPVESILSPIDDDVTNVLLHIDDKIHIGGFYILANENGEYIVTEDGKEIIVGSDPTTLMGYSLIGKTINIHGHAEDGSCDCDVSITVRSL